MDYNFKEVVRALRCCQEYLDFCSDCPYEEDRNCIKRMIKNAFDLIINLGTENNELREKGLQLKDSYIELTNKKAIETLNDFVKTAKREAFPHPHYKEPIITIAQLDEIKERLEIQNE